MNIGKYIALGQMALCFGAAVGYAIVHDWRRAAYWLFAGGIGATVTL